MSTERVREREVHRYYQTWLESSSGYKADEPHKPSDRFHPDGTSLKSSNDHILIAFAQLGCLRLGVKRAFVTLIASDRQYILAEATRSLSLISNLGADGEEDELWFGNASISRSEWISESALFPPEYHAKGSSGGTFSAPAMVINDITKDDRYNERPFAGTGITFYCGVPIISLTGEAIGTYEIVDDRPREGIQPVELAFMQDMSNIVMQHLRKVYNDVARFRGERMVVGLGNFIRGRSSMRETSSLTNEQTGYKTSELPQRSLPQPRKDSTVRFEGMKATDADPSTLAQVQIVYNSNSPSNSHVAAKNAPEPSAMFQQPERQTEPEAASERKQDNFESPPPKSMVPNIRDLRDTKMDKTFARAANIMRECIAADGVIFFDASSQHRAKTTKKTRSEDALESSETVQSTDSDGSISDAKDLREDRSTESDSSQDVRVLNSKGDKCQMLACSLDISAASSADVQTISKLRLTERSLGRLIRLYPRGKVFFFAEDGELSLSSGSDVANTPSHEDVSADSTNRQKRRSRKQISDDIAQELLRIIPGARNVIWLPLWNPNLKRWSAGTFVWSRNPNQLVAAQDDRVYLRTFGACIMTEMCRLDVQSADDAKSTFIGNISHELRSPLHGILGSLEFLQQTSLDAFQSSMTLAVDTCAKTLLDTVEHVLDFTKINNASAKFSRNRSIRSSRLNRRGSIESPDTRVRSGLEEDLNLATIFEEAVEAVYAGQSFRKAGVHQMPKMSDIGGVASSNKSDESPTTTKKKIENGSAKFSDAIRLILKIETCDNWWVRTQPGAIRRIVTNILSNALKYTDSGTIEASLSLNGQARKSTDKRPICISIKDTGRGMSASFLKNHAFTPFSQESQLSPGTGLGLSIVHQIVDSLGGSVDLRSEQNVGTTVKIFLDLPPAAVQPSLQIDEDIIAVVSSKVTGMSICMLDPVAQNLRHGSQGPEMLREPVEGSLRDLAKEWFGMKTTKSKNMEGISTDFFAYAEPPPIDYLLENHGQHARRTEIPLIVMATNAFENASLTFNGIHRLKDLGRVLEVISQPCGPLKLARTLHRCLSRLDELAQTSNLVTDEEALSKVSEKTPGHEQSAPQTPSREDLNEKKTSSLSHAAQTSPNFWSSLVSKGSRTEITAPDRPPVLLVDDNDINLDLLVAMVHKAKHPYETAKTGTEAVEAFDRANGSPETRFKYVLMDINMPVMDGITATRKIRRLEHKSDSAESAVVIAVTGFAAESTRKEMFDAGADYFLSKPVKFRQLVELLGGQ